MKVNITVPSPTEPEGYTLQECIVSGVYRCIQYPALRVVRINGFVLYITPPEGLSLFRPNNWSEDFRFLPTGETLNISFS